MRFTPNNNWPIAEDTDVVKQYPTTIDEPFKMALDAQVFASGLQGMHVEYGHTACTVSSNGAGTIPYGYTFGAIPFLMAVIGEEAPSANVGYCQMLPLNQTTTTGYVRIFNTAGAILTSGTIRITWLAIGPPTP